MTTVVAQGFKAWSRRPATTHCVRIIARLNRLNVSASIADCLGSDHSDSPAPTLGSLYSDAHRFECLYSFEDDTVACMAPLHLLVGGCSVMLVWLCSECCCQHSTLHDQKLCMEFTNQRNPLTADRYAWLYAGGQVLPELQMFCKAAHGWPPARGLAGGKGEGGRGGILQYKRRRAAQKLLNRV
jgi:hypothetical protein